MKMLRSENENLDNQVYEKSRFIQRLTEEKESILQLREKET